MFNNAVKSILEFGSFSKDALVLFESKLQVKQYLKNDFLVKPEDICQTFYFLNSGSCKHFFLDDRNEESIVNLYLANDWVTEFHSFTAQKPSGNYIQAFEDSEVVFLKLIDFHALIQQDPHFFMLGKLLNKMSYPNFSDNANTPVANYNRLMENRPGLLLKFPLKTIASYLRITPETLSRVRAKA